ncbi:MAG: hypothetical protein EA428_00715 [Spirochaetaceae bacterium]|nr:MAG: hypothetical protein EA428_00715 [Spirochaetaceae bacterium]
MTQLLWKVSDASSHSLEFRLDSAACTGCGICSSVCPYEKILNLLVGECV